jgi:hypothetical protein
MGDNTHHKVLTQRKCYSVVHVSLQPAFAHIYLSMLLGCAWCRAGDVINVEVEVEASKRVSERSGGWLDAVRSS